MSTEDKANEVSAEAQDQEPITLPADPGQTGPFSTTRRDARTCSAEPPRACTDRRRTGCNDGGKAWLTTGLEHHSIRPRFLASSSLGVIAMAVVIFRKPNCS